MLPEGRQIFGFAFRSRETNPGYACGVDGLPDVYNAASKNRNVIHQEEIHAHTRGLFRYRWCLAAHDGS
jgi:hypothetical protein